jgi:hypothetical protein
MQSRIGEDVHFLDAAESTDGHTRSQYAGQRGQQYFNLILGVCRRLGQAASGDAVYVFCGYAKLVPDRGRPPAPERLQGACVRATFRGTHRACNGFSGRL